jgi:hypothetical protein
MTSFRSLGDHLEYMRRESVLLDSDRTPVMAEVRFLAICDEWVLFLIVDERMNRRGSGTVKRESDTATRSLNTTIRGLSTILRDMARRTARASDMA